MQSMSDCTVYAHSLCHISHTQQSMYTSMSMYISIVCMMSVMEVCEILEFGFCGCVSRISVHALEVRYSLSMTAAVSSLCAVLSSSSILKNCWVALLGLALGLCLVLGLRLELGLASVLVFRVMVSLELRFHVKTGRTTSSHIFVKNWNSVTQHTSINKLSPPHRYILNRWVWQPLRYKRGKYDIK